MRTLEAIVTALAHGEDADQVRAIIGDRPAGAVADSLGSLVRRGLGAEVVGCTYHHVSVGLTLELRLGDGRHCVLKAGRVDDQPAHRAAALQVQAHLAARGFVAPAVLLPPGPCAGAEVYVVEALDRGEPVHYDAALRDTMAREYARLLVLSEEVGPVPGLAEGSPQGDRLWPTPHSVIFDFEGTRASAAPIDALAESARAQLTGWAAPLVVAHCDWSLQNVSFRGGVLRGVFDWDSLQRVPEVLAVAGASAFAPQDWRVGPQGVTHDFYPGPEDALAFAEVYAQARGRAWTQPQQCALEAALVLRLGYQARCEHALDPHREGPAHRRLVRFAEAFGLG